MRIHPVEQMFRRDRLAFLDIESLRQVHMAVDQRRPSALGRRQGRREGGSQPRRQATMKSLVDALFYVSQQDSNNGLENIVGRKSSAALKNCHGLNFQL